MTIVNESNGNGLGHRRPPPHTRFKKGQSGNPRGRPKNATTFKADLAAELKEKLSLTENGRTRKITKQRAFIKTLTEAAIKRDIRAVNALLACMRLFGVGNDEAVAEPADVDDLELLETYLAQQRKRDGRREKSGVTAPASRKGK